MRKIEFVKNEYYHIYNRGVDKRETFLAAKDYEKFLNGLRDFNNLSYYPERKRVLMSSTSTFELNFKELDHFLDEQERVVDIISYSLIPNHFHLVLRQLQDEGVSNFMHKLGTSHTNYFNKAYNRSGSLFQGPYKAIHIDSEEYLLWLVAYVNGNPEIHGLGEAKNYSWSSLRYFLGEGECKFLGEISIILEQFESLKAFQNFVRQVVKESKIKKEIKKYLLE